MNTPITTQQRARIVEDWYRTHPSNNREPRPGTQTLGQMQRHAFERQIADRIQAAIEWNAGPKTGPMPERVYYRSRHEYRAESARIRHRRCDGVNVERVICFRAIRTPWHGYSDAALKIERNARKRERRARAGK